MADIGSEVHITGTDLPQWASETTLEKLLETVEKLTNTSEQQKRILDKSLREIQKTGKSESGTGLTGSKKDISLTKALTSGLRDAGHSALDVVGGFDKLGGPLKTFGKALKDTSAGMKVGLAAMGGVFAIFGKGAAIYKSSADTMIGLANTGITIEDSFLGINRTLATTGMSLEQFNEISTKYSRVVGQNGWRAINKLVEATDKASGGFDTMALSTADATEYAVEYLEQQRMVGVFRTIRERDQSAALAENMKQLTMYSKVLNVSRDDLQDATREMMGNAGLQAELFSMAPKQREAAQKAFKETGIALASLGAEGQEALKMMTDMAATPNPYGSPSYIKLVEAGQTEYANSLLEMGLANKRGQAYSIERIKQEFAVTEEFKRNAQGLRFAGAAIKEEADARLVLGLRIEEAGRNEIENRRKFGLDGREGETFLEFLGRVNKDSEGVTKIVDSMNKITATFDRGIIEVVNKMVESFAGENGIGNMADSAGEKLGAVAAYANKWLDDFRKTDDAMGMITDAVLGSLGTIMTTVGNMLVAAIQAGFRMLKGGDQSLSESSKLIAEGELGGMTFAERKAADRASQVSGSRGNSVRIRSVNERQTRITQGDIEAQAARKNRAGDADLTAMDQTKGSGLGSSQFEEQLLQYTKEQRDEFRKMVKEVRGGAFGNQ